MNITQSGLLALTLLVAPVAALSPATAPLRRATPAAPRRAADVDHAAVVERLAALLVERYVWADVAEECAAHLRAELAAGRFDGLDEPAAFAEALTSAAQSVTHDKHLRITQRPPEQVQVMQTNPRRAMAQGLQRERENNFGFARVERLEGNVGYLDMRYFSGAPEARPTAAAAMNFLANSDALVFDMRQNGGGDPDMIRFVSSWLFAEPTHLNSLYWRRGDRTDEFWTLADFPGTPMPDVPVFVLTSDYTFSGAEEFSYNLRTRERATLVGEVTGGGANPGGVVPIDDVFGVFIPVGSAVNPITGTNWEGTGVTPHVAIDAEAAYERGVALAREAADAYREQRQEAVEAAWADYDDGLEGVQRFVDHERYDDAMTTLADTVRAAHGAGIVSEPDLNMLGYDYLGRGASRLAIEVFRLNVDFYPESSNVYDSLAEAYMESGDDALAIDLYGRSLELDPGNENAKARLATLRARAQR